MEEDDRSNIDKVINEEQEFRKKLEEDTKRNAGYDYYFLLNL
jgi:hypothetical protein